MRLHFAACALVFAACSQATAPTGSTDRSDGGTLPSVDLAPVPPPVPVPDLLGPLCGGIACPAPSVCRFDTCIDPPSPCAADGDCQDDSYCVGSECLPYGIGPRGPTNAACQRQPVIGLFAPKPKCEWTGPKAGEEFAGHQNVLSTPLVVDFDFDGDKTTLHPSIVFASYNCEDGGCGGDGTTCYGVIRILDGNSCALQHSIGSPALIGDVTPAVGDLDGDGRADIVMQRIGGGVAGYKYDAVQKKFVEMWPGQYSSFNASGCHWDSVAIHDLDDDGVPEILQNGPNPAVYSNQGVLIDGASTVTMYGQALHPVLADVDGDGAVEMLDGKQGFRFDKATRKWVVASGIGGPALGQVALADFGTFAASGDDRAKKDGVPEVAVVTSGQVRVQTLDGRVVFGPLTLPGSTPGTGGAPTIADFDGDGKVEIGVAGATAYTVFDPDETDGVSWSRVSQDLSSNVTGSSVFDFDGDGRSEVVYADECFSRVYDGVTGEVLHSQYHTSCTWYENPIVADTDGDLKADMVIPSNSNCNVGCPALDPIHDGVRCSLDADCPGTSTCGREAAGDKYGRCRCADTAACGSDAFACADPAAGVSAAGKVCRAAHPTGAQQRGILVLHDALDRWVYSRPIWNQHAYAVTGVNDDGTIPKTSAWKQNWKEPKLNNFRMNVQGALSPLAVPDFTASGNGALGRRVSLPCVDGKIHLEAKLCNRGTGPQAAGAPLTFYAKGAAICTVKTAQVLQAGACEVVGCDWENAPQEATDVTMVANDDGKGTASAECEARNNSGILFGVACNEVK